MCIRFQGSVCLLLASLVACIACHSPHSFGEDPPTQLVEQSEWEARIEAALDAKGEWDFEEVPLDQLCGFIRETLGIDIVLDVKSLEDYGIEPSTPITVSLRGVSNRSFLRLMLKDLDLTYTTRLGALWITTFEYAESHLTTKVYPVGDLIEQASVADDRVVDYDTLEQAIMSVIAPDAWDQVGGPGVIRGIYGSLVVSQTSEIHEEVSRFLQAYRAIIENEQDPDVQQHSVFLLGQHGTEAIQAALDKPFTAVFEDVALKEAIAFVSDAMRIPIVIDTIACDDFGIDTGTPINANFKELPLRFALARVLNQLELTYTIRDEVLYITTPEADESQLLIGLYPVRDLVRIAAAPTNDPSGMSSDFDSLIETISSTIAPDSWDEVGGPSAIEALPRVPTLVVSQTQAQHEEISDLLATLRAAKKLEAARTAANEDVDPTALNVRSYPIYAAYHAPDEVVKLVMRASEPGTWDEDTGAFVQSLGMSIVVKHNADGHRQVQKLLAQLGVWSPQVGRGRKGFGGGGAAPATGAQPAAPVGGGGLGDGRSGGGFF